MSFGQAIKAVFKKYAVFEGTADRAEFWWWTLFSAIILGGLSILGFITAVATGAFIDPNYLYYNPAAYALASVFSFGFFGFLWYVAWLGLFIPSVAVLVRRLRDTGRKAWYLLLLAVPVAGPITILVIATHPSVKAAKK